MKMINKARFEYDQVWDEMFDGSIKTLSNWRDFVKKLMEMLEKTEIELTNPLAEMVKNSAMLMDPVVEILYKMLQEKSEEEKQETKVK